MSHALHIAHSDSTYRTAKSDSWLDVFILDSLSKVVSYIKSDAPFIASHDLLELVYQFDVPPDPARTITRRNYRRFNEHAFRSELEVICSKALNCETATSSNVEVLPDLLSSVIVSALHRHVRLRTFRVHRPRAPWLTNTWIPGSGTVTLSSGGLSVLVMSWLWRFTGSVGMNLAWN